MQVVSLASGSTGNACLIQTPVGALLVDAGLPQKTILARCARFGTLPEHLLGIIVTHEHGDHIGCATALALRHGIPVWMSQGTYEAISSPDLKGLLRIAKDSEVIHLGDLQVMPFTVPHDAREPLQLTCQQGSDTIWRNHRSH